MRLFTTRQALHYISLSIPFFFQFFFKVLQKHHTQSVSFFAPSCNITLKQRKTLGFKILNTCKWLRSHFNFQLIFMYAFIRFIDSLIHRLWYIDSICLSVCLSLCLSVSQSVSQPASESVRPSVLPAFVRASMRSFIHSFIHLIIHLLHFMLN